MADELLSLTL